MNTRRLLLLGAVALAIFSASRAQQSQSPLERTRQARTHIDALLGPRRNPPPLPENPSNPFAIPGGTIVAADPSSNNDPIPAVASEQELLARVLKLGGTAMLNGRQQLIVNQLAYKEGDLIAVRDGDQILRVRLLRIAPPSAVFELNGAEVILRIRN